MNFSDYVKPDNPIAQAIVYMLLGLFVLWFLLLLWNVARNLFYSSQLKRCEDVDGLLVSPYGVSDGGGRAVPPDFSIEGERVFGDFRAAKGLNEKGPIARHLHALFAAGWNESQLDARALVKNTADRIFRAHGLHRALLSIFIILGLLGTLFGLADALSLLADALRGGSQVDNERLNQGLQHLLGSLKGAFGPSILGVLLTVVGVVLFALYQRFIAAPLAGALERITLTVWVPRLVPTASQKLLDKLQLSERQMQRSFDAARRVADFAENIQNKTGTFGETLEHASAALTRMEKVSDGLSTFSVNFVEGAKSLAPELRSLYQQMLQESRAFQESVRSNIAGAEDFQRHIREQLDGQHTQLAEVLKSLRSYEAAYVTSRGEIDTKLGAVLGRAEEAFQNLSRRNEEIGRALDDALGKPLREEVTARLSAIEAALSSRLGGVENTLQVQLGALGERLRALDAPLNTAAQKFTDTFYNFNENANEWRTELQREFAQQNETNKQQLRRLDALSDQVPQLLEQISASSNNFTAGGQQLGQDISALSQNVAALGSNVEALGKQVGARPGGDGDRTAALLAQQVSILQELSGRIERLAAARSSVVTAYEGRQDYVERRKPRWRDRIRDWIPFVGRR
jgi:DNA repair exonuclease SbcCD ATPase subunit